VFRERRWLWLLPPLLVWAAILLTYGGFQEDDVFITFRYARNLALGHGFVFNIGEPHHFGSSAPLYTLIIAALGAPWPDKIPQIGFAISALGLLACAYGALAFWWDSERHVGLIAALLVLVNPLTYYSLGMELPVQVALILWGLYLCKREKNLAATALIATAILVRPDAIIAAAIALAYMVWKGRRIPFKEIALAALIITPFVIVAWRYFGSALPATVSAKQAQVESGIWRYYVPGVLNFLQMKFVEGQHMPVGPVVPTSRAMPLPIWWIWPFVCVAGCFFCRRAALPLLWVAGIVVAYQVGGVTFNAWYIYPLGIGVSLLVACAISWMPMKASLAVGTALSGFFIWYAAARATNCVDGRKTDYILAAKWLKANTPPDAKVGFCEIGLVGYYSERPIVDPLGLIHNDLDTHVAGKDFVYAFRKYRPEYIIDSDVFNALWTTQGAYGWIHGHYKPVVEFDEPGYRPVSILKRDDGSFPAPKKLTRKVKP
jgi:hypothetical protein